MKLKVKPSVVKQPVSRMEEIRALAAARLQILRALESRATPSMEKTHSGADLLEALLKELAISDKQALAKTKALAKAEPKPKKEYSYARVRVMRSDGLATTVSLSVRVYALACSYLPKKEVNSIIRAAALAADFRARPPSLSYKIRRALAARIRLICQSPDEFAEYGRLMQEAEPAVKLTPSERWLRYGSTYGKTYTTVAVPRGDGTRTVVSVTLPFYPRACAILGKKEVHATIRRSSVKFSSKATASSRSAAARETLVTQVLRLAA
jgi:hypothetical protein